VYPTPRDAATVILLRAGDPFEVFLLRRHRGSGFMANAYVFPGGAVDPGESIEAAAARELHEECGVKLPDLGALHYFAHWVTPSVEKKRFSARFFVAVLPAGAEPHFDGHETVDQAWVTPAEALAKSYELALPPPQIRTFHELAPCKSIEDVLALCARRAANPHPVMPRMAPSGTGFALLLPWDPEYETAGQGDAAPLPAGHPLAEGPSRFVMGDRGWAHR